MARTGNRRSQAHRCGLQFDCRVVESHDAGSHTIFVSEALAQTIADREPLFTCKGSFAVARAHDHRH
jgi:flavin reductase (DIM6/NTAB) family NADH-FMN oxidoreductase RutF